MQNEKRIGYFVSPHGFGHATRAAAVMQAISDLDASIEFEIFTTVPSWVFKDSVSASYNCHPVLTDIGLVQKSAFLSDLSETIGGLDSFLPFSAALISDISEAVSHLKCQSIICDISPLGIAVAREIGIPSILVENFTWDWIYEQYAATDHRFKGHIKYLRSLFRAADYHIQTEPVCFHHSPDLTTSPVGRKIKNSADRIRAQLDVPISARMVLITTGGISQSYGFLEKLKRLPEIRFVLPGAGPTRQILDNCIILPHHSDFYHPDLVNASDAVVGKVGYSTLAEVYHAGVPFGYVVRSNFRESEPLAAFIEKEMQGVFVEESHFDNGSWTDRIQDLLNLTRVQQSVINGADQIAGFIRDRI
jgi:hypothetical protein